MTRQELGRLYPVALSRYDERWPGLFESEKRRLLEILGREVALRIEHMGSTAVPGLAAKPTIDILVEIPEVLAPGPVIERMVQHGYIHMEEQRKHLMFVKGYSPAGLERESFHVHMGPGDQDWLWDRIHFRDYLRRNPSEAQRYQALKLRLAAEHRHDREAYTEAKADYVQRITAAAKRELVER